jgi:hypothetical protein
MQNFRQASLSVPQAAQITLREGYSGLGRPAHTDAGSNQSEPPFDAPPVRSRAKPDPSAAIT